ELLARVESVARRARTVQPKDEVLEVNELRVDCGSRRTEEWICGQAFGGLPQTRRHGRSRSAGAALCRRATIRKLLSAIVQTEAEEPQWRSHRQALWRPSDALCPAAGPERDLRSSQSSPVQHWRNA